MRNDIDWIGDCLSNYCLVAAAVMLTLAMYQEYYGALVIIDGVAK